MASPQPEPQRFRQLLAAIETKAAANPEYVVRVITDTVLRLVGAFNYSMLQNRSICLRKAVVEGVAERPIEADVVCVPLERIKFFTIGVEAGEVTLYGDYVYRARAPPGLLEAALAEQFQQQPTLRAGTR